MRTQTKDRERQHHCIERDESVELRGHRNRCTWWTWRHTRQKQSHSTSKGWTGVWVWVNTAPRPADCVCFTLYAYFGHFSTFVQKSEFTHMHKNISSSAAAESSTYSCFLNSLWLLCAILWPKYSTVINLQMSIVLWSLAQHLQGPTNASSYTEKQSVFAWRPALKKTSDGSYKEGGLCSERRLLDWPYCVGFPVLSLPCSLFRETRSFLFAASSDFLSPLPIFVFTSFALNVFGSIFSFHIYLLSSEFLIPVSLHFFSPLLFSSLCVFLCPWV